VAKSNVEETCLSSGKPLGLTKLLTVPPNNRDFLFIKSENSSTLPATCSANATAASFPDLINAPLSNSSTVSFSPASRYIEASPVEAEFLDISTSSDGLVMSKAKIAVKTLVVLAGGMGLKISFLYNIFPLSISINIALAAVISGPCA